MSVSTEGYVAAQLAAEPLHNVHDLLAKAVAAHPRWSAFTCGDTTFSCAELERRVDAFARYLRHHAGLQPLIRSLRAETAIERLIIACVGQPLIDTEICAMRDDGSQAPVGEPRELWVRGLQVMQGYWRRPDETAQTLTEDGWLKTGDICVIDEDNLLKIVDRKKDMILVSGFNVFPNEVEDAVMRHPSVRECVAVGVLDERKGEAVKIYVSLKQADVGEAELLAHCREQLTGYKVPSFVELRDELPKTAVGKLLRRQLRDEARAAMVQ